MPLGAYVDRGGRRHHLFRGCRLPPPTTVADSPNPAGDVDLHPQSNKRSSNDSIHEKSIAEERTRQLIPDKKKRKRKGFEIITDTVVIRSEESYKIFATQIHQVVIMTRN